MGGYHHPSVSFGVRHEYIFVHRGVYTHIYIKPILAPVDLPNPGNEPGSPALQMDSLPTELSEKLINT